MVCNKCGKEIPDKSAFCSYCGIKIVTEKEKRNKRKKLHFKIGISSLSICLVLIILYLIWFIINYQEVNGSIKDMLNFDNVCIKVIMNKNISSTQENKLKEQIGKIEGIKSIEYISPEDALDIMKKQLGNEYLYGIDSSIFTSSYDITLSNSFKSKRICKEIENFENVEKVANGYEKIYKNILVIGICSVINIGIIIGIIVLAKKYRKGEN